MEGYSVTEAASVLGVPTERVWELLARGVLSGVPDGETGMRVFLQPRPAPPAVEEPRRSNGGGSSREPEAEASPFRELLSEFRNLTERYGQALLALGESRGEVASLRSRVDLLEARFDLRLPMSGPMTAPPPAPRPPAAGWNPRVARPMGETPSAADEAAGGPLDHDDAEPSPPRRRRRGQHRAVDDFAEALARAEDPSPAELPGAEEAAAAFAAMRDEAAHRTAEHADASLPRELPAAEPIAIIEPDNLAEDVREPTAMSPAVEAEAAVVEEAPEPISESQPAPAIEAETVVEDALEPISESQPAPAIEAEAVVEDAEAVVEEAETVVDAVPAPIPEAQPLPTVEPQIAFDGLPLESEPEPESEYAAEPEAELDQWFEPGPEPEPEPEPVVEVEPHAEPVVEAPSSEAEPDALVEALPEPVAEAPPWTLAEAEVAPEPEPAAVSESVEVELPSAPMLAAGSEPTDEVDEEPEEPAEAEPASEQAARAEPALEPEAESEPAAGTEPEDVADSELSWDRDRYTAQIGEPDWIPEEREVQPFTSATAPPVADGPSADARLAASDTKDSDAEASMPEPPWTGEPDRSTPTGEETMLWFGREPNRAAPAWPAEEDDSAAEMEVASTGGRAAWSRTVPEDPIGLRRAPAVPPVDPPDIRAEYRATLAKSQPDSPASRAYRRLRRIFPS